MAESFVPHRSLMGQVLLSPFSGGVKCREVRWLAPGGVGGLGKV